VARGMFIMCGKKRGNKHPKKEGLIPAKKSIMKKKRRKQETRGAELKFKERGQKER